MIKVFQHYRNKQMYMPISYNIKLQENGVWKDAVLYVALEEEYAVDGHEPMQYARTVEEFNSKFKEI